MNLRGKRVCLYHNGSGSIGSALKVALADLGVVFVDDVGPEHYDIDGCRNVQQTPDIAICTSGKMLIQDAGLLTHADVHSLYRANYLVPREFTERHIAAMIPSRVAGLILHIGSNSARYGKPGAEDYAAFKAALWKYTEIRGKAVAKHGIRIVCLNLGGIVNGFWDQVRKSNFNAKIAEDLIPSAAKGMTNNEVVETIIGVLQLPEHVCMKDALIVSREYQ